MIKPLIMTAFIICNISCFISLALNIFLLMLRLTVQGHTDLIVNSKLRNILNCILFRSFHGSSSPYTYTIVASATMTSNNATTMAMTPATCIHSNWRKHYQVRKQLKLCAFRIDLSLPMLVISLLIMSLSAGLLA